MEPTNSNDHTDNFQNFIKMQKEIMETFPTGANVGITVLQLDELFKFFGDNFNKFHQKENFRVVLAFIHRCLKMWVSRGDYMKEDIGISLIYFMADHRENENDLNIVIQIVYQIMNSLKYFGNSDVRISQKLLRELIFILDEIKSRFLISNCIACIQLYMQMFPENFTLYSSIWSNLRTQLETNLKCGIIQDIKIDILIQLIDEFKSTNSNFYQEHILIDTIQQLLKSDQRKYRKCGYYLFKKLLQYFIENIENMNSFLMSNDHIQQIERSWTIYITIMENLEEEQSHLILPSLQNLKEIIENKHLDSLWMEILYMRILTHNNNLVLRWSIEFILKSFPCSDLSAGTLKYLLQATNSNMLYNYEGYFLNEELLNMFLKNDLKKVLILLPEIENWKSVPLYMWLEYLNKSPLPKLLTFEEVLKISACVRKLQNSVIRGKAIEMCNQLFNDFVNKMSMEEYVTYVETLYNSSDNYNMHKIFFNKKSSLINSLSNGVIFKQRFYDIFTYNKWCNRELLSFLNDVPVSNHGWLKFAPFKLKLTESDLDFICNLYKMDLKCLATYDLQELIKIFENNLLDSQPHEKQELRECHQAAISYYIYNKPDLNINNEDQLRFILNSGINAYAVKIFAKKILNSNNQINFWFIDELLKYVDLEVYECILNYLIKVPNDDIVRKYIVKVFENGKDKIEIYDEKFFSPFNFLKDCINALLQRVSSKGEARIEEVFCYERFSYISKTILNIYIIIQKQICSVALLTFGIKYINDLLEKHNELTKKKPRYFENSHEHRIKLRIAYCIYNIFLINHDFIVCDSDTLNKIWNILLNENNQLNIIYIYEYILGIFENRENFIINKLEEVQNLTSSQQASIISVCYAYCLKRNISVEIKNTVITSLLGLAMGANFQTRLLAQMSLYKLLKQKKFREIEGHQQIIDSIEYAAREKLQEYLNDIRFFIHSIQKPFTFQNILYMTNAPFDEYNPDIPFIYEPQKSKHYREVFIKKAKHLINENTISHSTITDQIQRKMNPVNDLTEPHNLIIYPIEEKSAEMFVIASLIDKLPNLGGIARTCEVLGIHNLVMDSKKHTEKSDFKNLSMTAEKSLNIVEVKPKDLKEFLLNKKLEGFSILGAEQTNNSKNFNDFKFPQKCVLLLGHEKDGIPAPLLGLLDYAVEIPQFGQVRSLNVHVTGALFMWEYCKQHLVQKK